MYLLIGVLSKERQIKDTLWEWFLELKIRYRRTKWPLSIRVHTEVMRTHRKWLGKENKRTTDTRREVEKPQVRDDSNEPMVPHDVSLYINITSFTSYNCPMRWVL